MAAIDRLSDTFPVTSSPHMIINDMFVVIIYDYLSAQNFPGQAVFADIGSDFEAQVFQASHIKLGSYAGSPSASISLPPSILREAEPTGDYHRIVFNFFLNDSLFIQRDTFTAERGLDNLRLGGLAVAAHIAGGAGVSDLMNPINMIFTINPVSC